MAGTIHFRKTPQLDRVSASVSRRSHGGILTRCGRKLFFTVALGKVTMSLGHQDCPVYGCIHERHHVDNTVEQAEVESLARVGLLGRRRHLQQDPGFPSVVILIAVGIVEMGEAPGLRTS